MPGTAPRLLNDDGSASMATALMMSHHGFRRDLAFFAIGLRHMATGDPSRAAALQEEWKSFHGHLHGHHEAEDQGIFPHLAAQDPALAAVIAQLSADHRGIDPLLERGDRAFAQLPAIEAALAVVSELSALLDPHLATEEARVVPFLREAKEFPAPASEDQLALYAEGFAWASHGVGPEVLARLDLMLPEGLRARLPAARVDFEERCRRVWGSADAGASHTPIPDWIAGR